MGKKPSGNRLPKSLTVHYGENKDKRHFLEPGAHFMYIYFNVQRSNM